MPKNLELSYLIDFYGDVLTEKQREVMDQYYNADLSLAEIAENFGITRQGVRDSIKRGEGVLLDLEEKVGFVHRHRALQGKLQQMDDIAREIAYRNKTAYVVSDEIAENAQKLLTIIAELAE